MIPQGIKNVYWAAMVPGTLVSLAFNSLRYRIFSKLRGLFVNLGCGAGRGYVEGFINIDGNLFVRKDLWLDVRFGLPFPAGSARVTYLSHMIEHFSFQTALGILRDCRRVTAEEGGVRVVVPSLQGAIDAYVKKDARWFDSFPERFRSLGGQFNNYLLCGGQHRQMYDYPFMEELLHSADFPHVYEAGFGSSRLVSKDLLARMEPEASRRFFEQSLIVEAFPAPPAGPAE